MQQQRRQRRRKAETILLYGYYVATWIVGFAAIAGFYLSMKSFSLSIESSREVSLSLERVTNAIVSLTTLLIKIIKMEWTKDVDSINCDNHQTGILLYANMSNVPIQLHNAKIIYFYGDSWFTNAVTKIEGKNNIMIPGEPLIDYYIDKEEFKRYLYIKNS